LRAITRAVDRVNENKAKYVRYFLQAWAGRPELVALTPADFDLGRIQLIRPGPFPERDARWAWDWMVSWGILQGDFDAASQIDNRVAESIAAV
jgi:hypothetical protein